MARNTLQFSFNSGEISPRMHGRVDLEKFFSGCSELTNFIPHPQGGVSRRQGTSYVFSSATNGDEESWVIPFAPSSTNANVIVFQGGNLGIFSNEGEVLFTVAIPYASSELSQLRYVQQVDVLILVHPNHAPRILKYIGPPAPLFTFGKLTDDPLFKCPPLGKIDTSATTLTVSDESYLLKVSSLTANFVIADVGKFIEYKIGEDWALYEIKQVLSSTAALVEPKTAVINGIDPKASFYLLKGNYPERTFPETDPTTHHELRCDTALFSYDLEDAYLRVTLDSGVGLDTWNNKWNKVWQKDTFGTSCIYEAGDVWVRLNEYRGQYDYSAQLYQGSMNISQFETGNIYKIVANPSTGAFLWIIVGAPLVATPDWQNPLSEPVDWDRGFHYRAVGDTFAASQAFGFVYTGASGEVKQGGVENATCVANLTKSQSFDVARVSAPLTMKAVPDIIFEDEAAQTVHTAKLTASAPIFTADDVGRFVNVNHRGSWVLYKIAAFAGPDQVIVSVRGTIPKESGTEIPVNNGNSSVFAFSTWFDSAGKVAGPSAVAIFEQRLVFSGPPNDPETICFSKTSDQFDFRTAEEDGTVLDSSGISYTIAGAMYNKVTWLISSRTLLIGTSHSECQLRSQTFGDPLTPSNVRITHETFNGSPLAALSSGPAALYAGRGGNRLYEMVFDYELNAFRSVDLNVLADHLFENDPIRSMAYQRSPRQTIWVVTESGIVYSLLYEKDQNVYAWARHDFGAKMKSVCVSPTGSALGDQVYFTGVRESTAQGGHWVLERLLPDFYDDGSNNLKPNINTLDCSIKIPYETQTVVSSISLTGLGLSNLFEDATLSVIADGAYLGDFPVVGSDVVFDEPKTVTNHIYIGFNFRSILRTLPMAYESEAGSMLGQNGRIKGIVCQLFQSIGFSYGPDDNNLQAVNFHPTVTTMDQSPKLFSGFKTDLTFDADYDSAKQITIVQDQPYPLTLLSLSARI